MRSKSLKFKLIKQDTSNPYKITDISGYFTSFQGLPCTRPPLHGSQSQMLSTTTLPLPFHSSKSCYVANLFPPPLLQDIHITLLRILYFLHLQCASNGMVTTNMSLSHEKKTPFNPKMYINRSQRHCNSKPTITHRKKKSYQPVRKKKLNFICAGTIIFQLSLKNYPFATRCHIITCVFHKIIFF